MNKIYVLMKEDFIGVFPMAAYSDKEVAEKDRELRQYGPDGKGGPYPYGFFWVEEIPMFEQMS